MCCLLTWISDPQKEIKKKNCIGKFGCALGVLYKISGFKMIEN
jgi:hypothetical protein